MEQPVQNLQICNQNPFLGFIWQISTEIILGNTSFAHLSHISNSFTKTDVSHQKWSLVIRWEQLSCRRGTLELLNRAEQISKGHGMSWDCKKLQLRLVLALPFR